jgi:HSP20 family protein
MQLIYSQPRPSRPVPGREFDHPLASDAHTRRRFSPAVDIYEEVDRYVVEADLPGIDAAAIELTVEHDLLTLKGERNIEPTGDDVSVQRTERPRGRFERVFRLPETASGEGVEAAYKHGVLRITIPKAKAAMPYRIEVNQH